MNTPSQPRQVRGCGEGSRGLGGSHGKPRPFGPKVETGGSVLALIS